MFPYCIQPHQRHTSVWRWAFLGGCVLSGLAQAQAPDLSEGAFFDEMPVVLTVSRLAQPLNDTPGAVTVIDRETIKRSGARTLTDVLRLVPGYIVSGYNGANPAAFYHATLDEFGGRNLVLVDGRSLYTATFLGGTHRGMLTVQLDDIERVEVLRGSNSAAYGANALFGVINVITRHSADTVGSMAEVSVGEADIRDAVARVGWASEKASHRLTVGKRSDSGYRFVFDDSDVSQLEWRSDFTLNGQDELQLNAGYTDGMLADGVPRSNTNKERETGWSASHLQGIFKRQHSKTAQSRWSGSLDTERVDDALLGISLKLLERRLQLEYQFQDSLNDSMRFVWGGGYKQDSAVAPLLFDTVDRLKANDARLFGNLEWTIDPRWLLNAGVYVGHNSITGGYANPRLMFNHTLAPGHTLRFGVAHAQREPALFQLYSDVKYYIGGNLIRQFFKPNPSLQPEQLRSHEISYLGLLPKHNLTVDARLYSEELNEQLVGRNNGRNQAGDYINGNGVRFDGLDAQVKWSNGPETQVFFNYNINKMRVSSSQIAGAEIVDKSPPLHLASLVWFKRLPNQWDMSWMLHRQSSMAWRGGGPLEATNRVDFRLAKKFLLGKTRAEAALTVLSLNGDTPVFRTDLPSVFTRRAFTTLKLEL